MDALIGITEEWLLFVLLIASYFWFENIFYGGVLYAVIRIPVLWLQVLGPLGYS